VIEDFTPSNEQPSCIPLRVSRIPYHNWCNQELTT
jgi:hypothetical protein